MTLFDLLHKSKLFNTGAEVRRFIMQGEVQQLVTTSDPNDGIVSGARFVFHLNGERVVLVAP